MSLRYKIGVLKFKIKLKIAQLRAIFLSSSKDLELILHKRVLVISPHPDDEVFGCGGLIMRCTANGIMPSVVILSGGGNSLGCNVADRETIVTERMKLTDRAAKVIGLQPENIYRFFLEDGRIGEEIKDADKFRDVLLLLKSLKPDIVMVPSILDDFADHKAAHKLGIMLCDAMRKESKSPELWNYCVWAWYYYALKLVKQAGRFVCLKMNDDELRRKKEAINIYVEPDSKTGIYWSSKLPPLFVAIHRWNRELYYKA